MEPVCYHKCSKSLLPNRDVANDSNLEKIVGGRDFFWLREKKNDSIPNFQRVSIIRFFPLQKPSPDVSLKYWESFHLIPSMELTYPLTMDDWKTAYFQGNVSGSVISKSDGTKWGVFFWHHPHLLIISKKEFFLSQNDRKMTPTYLTYLLQKKRVGARKNEERILDWSFSFGCFFLPPKKSCPKNQPGPSEKRVGWLCFLGLTLFFGKVLLDSHWPPVLRSWFLGWWYWLKKQIVFRVIRFPHWFC